VRLGSLRLRIAVGYFRFARRGFRNRTPSPVPFSSMNSIPASSKARRIAASLASVTGSERKFWHCVENGEPPTLFGVEPPKPRIDAVRVVDMSTSNAWAEFAGIFIHTRDAHLAHEQAKAELRRLVPGDAQKAIGHGVCAKRSNAGIITFEMLKREDGDAAVQ
jgi:hypothetical protein